jgi:phosphonate transport system permease protein
LKSASLLKWPAILIVVAVYAIGWQVTDISLPNLILGAPKIRPVVRSLLRPDMLVRNVEVQEAIFVFESPCSEMPPAIVQPSAGQLYLIAEPTCGNVGDPITLRGGNFLASQTGEVWWENPIGQESRLRAEGQFVDFETDGQGQFSRPITVPDVVPELFRSGPQNHEIKARIATPVGRPHFSETFWLVLQRMGETIAQALMATTLGILLAVPISFFAARNLMLFNPVGAATYYMTRTILNILRSVEPLIMAIVFVVWVGLGPFAGVLALIVHTIAALGKLYSEAIESIDPGPIEAITATGANRVQVVMFAVLPQVLPPFVAFSIYRWDINVRMSTVLGFVGGGGIGFLLQQWIHLSEYNEAATAIWAIAIAVTVLDYASAQVRERIV